MAELGIRIQDRGTSSTAGFTGAARASGASDVARVARASDAAGHAGFTLIEMMVAIGILVFGITALIGVLTVGVSTRRTAEQKARAVLLADQVLHHLEQHAFAGGSQGLGMGAQGTPGQAMGSQGRGQGSSRQGSALQGIPPLEIQSIDGYPGLGYRVEFTPDPEDQDLVLARVAVRWREQGEFTATEFQRIMRREEPFARRVARLRSNQ